MHDNIQDGTNRPAPRTLTLRGLRRTGAIVAAAGAVGLVGLSLAGVAHASGGNNGTLKIHEKGTPSNTESNDPKLCEFNVEGFGFDEGQTGYIEFTVQGNDKPTGTNAGPYAWGPANTAGFYATQYFNLDDGHYKATLYGKDAGGYIDRTDEKAKSKVFKINCKDDTPSSTTTTSTVENPKADATASAECISAKVGIGGTFVNLSTREDEEKSTKLNVTATSPYGSDSFTVDGNDAVDWLISTNLEQVSAGSVTFVATWADGSPGTFTVTRSFDAQNCKSSTSTTTSPTTKPVPTTKTNTATVTKTTTATKTATSTKTTAVVVIKTNTPKATSYPEGPASNDGYAIDYRILLAAAAILGFIAYGLFRVPTPTPPSKRQH